MTTKTYNTEPLPQGSPLPKPLSEDDIIREIYKSKINYDNKPVSEIVLSASKRANIPASFLLSSALQEGLNKAVLEPDKISKSYEDAVKKGSIDEAAFPVDGFFNYGLDYFGADYERLKKYLPEGFDKRFKSYEALPEDQEKRMLEGKPYKTSKSAAFMTNEDALIAKAAVMRNAQDKIDFYIKEKGVEIPDEDKNYFVLAYYNGGPKRAQQMIQEYSKAKDKKKFIEGGETTLKGIHKNIEPRLKRMKFLDQLINEQTSQTL